MTTPSATMPPPGPMVMLAMAAAGGDAAAAADFAAGTELLAQADGQPPVGQPALQGGSGGGGGKSAGPGGARARPVPSELGMSSLSACRAARPAGHAFQRSLSAAEAARGLQADGEALTIEQKTKSSLQATASAGGSDAAGLAAAGPAVMAAAACWLAP